MNRAGRCILINGRRIRMNHTTTMSVKEAAERLEVREETIRAGLISGVLDFGRAVKCKQSYSYIIPRKRLEMWEAGEDLKPAINFARLKNFKLFYRKHKTKDV
jgi:hypothetical protein